MKSLWKISLATAALSVAAAAQTAAANGSASGGASVSPGQAGASVNSSQNAQAGGAQAGVNASGSAQASRQEKHEHGAKTKSDNSSNSAANAGGATAALASGTMLQAQLTKPVDAKKAKPGDQVTAKLTQDVKSNGHVVLHKGSKLIGHVTEAQARSKEQGESKLGIVFDKAELKGGQEASVNAVIQALAPPVQSSAMAAANEESSLSAPMGGGGPVRSGGGGLVGGVAGGATSTVGAATGTVGGVGAGATGGLNSTVNSTAGGATGALNAQGELASASRGVVGMQGLTLNSVSSATAQGSVISSTSRNVKLDGGTQMVLQVTGAVK
jgi:hypothetical protein